MRLRVLAATLLIVSAACTAGTPAESLSEPGSPSVAPSVSPRPTPQQTTVDAYPALIIDLGAGAAPIDVVSAFGSIWVANHRTDDVVRINPTTGAEEARIFVGDLSGPGYFSVAEDAVWVTRQNGRGIARIDPTTNELSPRQAGRLPPCTAPAVVRGAVWYFACDTSQMVRIDLATREETFVTATGFWNPIAVEDDLYAVGPDGVVRLSDDGQDWTVVGGCCGRPIGFAGGTLWLADTDALIRVDLATGEIVATIPIDSAFLMTANDETAWLTLEGNGPVQQIRIADNAILDGLPVSGSPTAVRFDGLYLWVTDFNTSKLWRVDLAGE